MDHGEKLNAEVGAQHERLWSKDEELDQLVDVFCEAGITIGDKWYTPAHFEADFAGNIVYDWWLMDVHNAKTHGEKVELIARYAEIKEQARREYVRKLGEQLESFIEDMAS